MAREGVNPRANKNLVFEIPDQESRVLRPRPKSDWQNDGLGDFSFQGNLVDILRHPEMYSHYPLLKGTTVKANAGPGSRYGGLFDEFAKQGHPEITASGKTWEELHSVLLHEANHAIQAIEGLDRGANPGSISDHLRKNVTFRDMLQNPISPADFGKALRAESLDRYGRNIGENWSNAAEVRFNNPKTWNEAMHPYSDMPRHPSTQLTDLEVYQPWRP
jgi:hypothetical protein